MQHLQYSSAHILVNTWEISLFYVFGIEFFLCIRKKNFAFDRKLRNFKAQNFTYKLTSSGTDICKLLNILFFIYYSTRYDSICCFITCIYIY